MKELKMFPQITEEPEESLVNLEEEPKSPYSSPPPLNPSCSSSDSPPDAPSSPNHEPDDSEKLYEVLKMLRSRLSVIQSSERASLKILDIKTSEWKDLSSSIERRKKILRDLERLITSLSPVARLTKNQMSILINMLKDPSIASQESDEEFYDASSEDFDVSSNNLMSEDIVDKDISSDQQKIFEKTPVNGKGIDMFGSFSSKSESEMNKDVTSLSDRSENIEDANNCGGIDGLRDLFGSLFSTKSESPNFDEVDKNISSSDQLENPEKMPDYNCKDCIDMFDGGCSSKSESEILNETDKVVKSSENLEAVEENCPQSAHPQCEEKKQKKSKSTTCFEFFCKCTSCCRKKNK